MKKTALIFLISIMMMSIFASAATNDGKILSRTENYGACVSSSAEIRNTCYNEAQAKLETCKNATTDKVEIKKCSTQYKADKNSCKATFQSTKKNECAKIKHTFFETIGSSMK